MISRHWKYLSRIELQACSTTQQFVVEIQKKIHRLILNDFLITDACFNDFSDASYLAFLLQQYKLIPEISVKNISKIFY